MIIPSTVPTRIGSPNTPNFFCIFSISKLILLTPGILSRIQLNNIAIGAYAVVNPCGSETPGSPNVFSTPDAVQSPNTIIITMFRIAAMIPYI